MSSLEKAPSEEGRPLGKLVLDPRGSCANAPNSARGPGFHSQKGKLKDHCGRGLGQGVVIATGVTLEWAVKKDKEYRAWIGQIRDRSYPLYSFSTSLKRRNIWSKTCRSHSIACLENIPARPEKARMP